VQESDYIYIASNVASLEYAAGILKSLKGIFNKKI